MKQLTNAQLEELYEELIWRQEHSTGECKDEIDQKIKDVFNESIRRARSA